jgi:hypothetical protein
MQGLSRKPAPSRAYPRRLNPRTAFFAGPIKHGFEHVELKVMFAEQVPFNFTQKITVQMNEGAAGFAFHVEMPPAFFFVVDVLVTGAFVIKQSIFADPSLGRQPLKVPVDGGLPNFLFHRFKMAYHLINRYMIPPQGLHIIENPLSLPGVIIWGPFIHHRSAS